jgi:hypothetical protein
MKKIASVVGTEAGHGAHMGLVVVSASRTAGQHIHGRDLRRIVSVTLISAARHCGEGMHHLLPSCQLPSVDNMYGPLCLAGLPASLYLPTLDRHFFA